MNKLLINITVPAYNEEKRIGTSLQTLLSYLRESALPHPYIVTVVNNGSTDRTGEIVEELAKSEKGVRALSLSEKGKGRAIKAGWATGGDVLVFMDADLSSDLSYFRPLIDAITERGFDISIGNRLGEHSIIEGRRAARSFLSRFYNALIRLTFASPIIDHQCGFKAIRKDVYERIEPLLKDDEWFFDTELLVWATRLRLRICELDIKWRDEQQSKVSLTRTPLAMLLAMYAFQQRLVRSEVARRRDHTLQLIGQGVRFLMSGSIAAIVNLALFWILFEFFDFNYIFDVIVTSVIVFFVSFALQKYWTFADMDRQLLNRQLALFAFSAAATVVGNILLISLLVEEAHLWAPLAQILSLGILACVNFFVYKLLIFRR